MAELDVSVLKQSVSFSFCLLQPFACTTRVPGTGTMYYRDFAFFLFLILFYYFIFRCVDCDLISIILFRSGLSSGRQPF